MIGTTLSHYRKGEPDWSALPVDTPQSIRRLLRRCLEKDLKERLHDIADARLEMREQLAESTATTPRARPFSSEARLARAVAADLRGRASGS